MRIGIDARMVCEHLTGIGRLVHDLLKKLADIDKENTYFVLYRDNALDFLEGVPNFNRCYSGLSQYSPRIQIDLPLFQWRNHLDVFHSTYFVKPIWEPCRSIVSIYDLLYSRYPHYLRKPASLYHDVMTTLAVKQADQVVTISQSSKKDLMECFRCPEKKIEVVIPGLDNEKFRIVSDESLINDTLLKYHLPEKYILYVGNHKPHKNIKRLIQAFAQISGEIEHYLVIGGHKESRYSEIYEIPKTLNIENRVIFTDEFEDADLPLIYNGAELFTYLSLHEGFGLPPLEAMACGVPVLTSNASSMPEAVGDAAITVDPCNVEEIARSLKTIATSENLRVEMRTKGLRRCQEFSWDRAAQQTLNLYEQVMRYTS